MRHPATGSYAWHDLAVSDMEVVDSIDFKCAIHHGHRVQPILVRQRSGVRSRKKDPAVLRGGSRSFADRTLAIRLNPFRMFFEEPRHPLLKQNISSTSFVTLRETFVFMANTLGNRHDAAIAVCGIFRYLFRGRASGFASKTGMEPEFLGCCQDYGSRMRRFTCDCRARSLVRFSCPHRSWNRDVSR